MRMPRKPTDTFPPLRAQACSGGDPARQGWYEQPGGYNGSVSGRPLALPVVLGELPCLTHARAVGRGF